MKKPPRRNITRIPHQSRRPTPVHSRGKRLSISVYGGPPDLVAKIRRTARTTLQSQGFGGGSLEIAVVGQQEMCRLHQLWLGHEVATDVLSFDLRECPRPGHVDGQVVVCAAVARRAARAHDTDWRGELLLYVVHGCLHLCGFDDRRPRDAARMHKEEDRLLTALGWGPVFSSRR